MPWRTHLKIENEIGCAIVTEKFLYARYDEGKNAEQLYDLERNPHQMWNDATKPELAASLAQHRARHDAVRLY